MSRRGRWLLASILAGAIVVVGASVVYAAGGGTGNGLAPSAGVSPDAVSIKGGCKKISKIDFATGEDIGHTTTSTTFVDVPGMSVDFTIGGQVRSCLKIEYSAVAFAPDDELMFVRALLDGAVAGSPSEVQLSGDDDEDVNGHWARSHAFNFAFANVAPGAHTIEIQWRSEFGGTVATHRRSVFVHHA